MELIGTQKARDDSIAALETLADAATEVYLQGNGSKKIVTVTIPEIVDENSFNITGNAFVLKIKGSDVTRQLNFPVTGITPNSSGTYAFQFISTGTGVVFSETVIPFVSSPTTISLGLCSPDTTYVYNTSITFSNNQDNTTDINMSTDLSNENVNLSVDPSSFTLAVGGDQVVVVNVTVAEGIIGTFSGTIYANSTGYTDPTPITVSVENCAAGNVSNVLVATFNSANYNVTKVAFTPAETVSITGTGWIPSYPITINVTNSTGGFASGYPKHTTTNSSGGFTDSFYSAGFTGDSYTVAANQSGLTNSSTFTLLSCG